jgi:hypothetical protein
MVLAAGSTARCDVERVDLGKCLRARVSVLKSGESSDRIAEERCEITDPILKSSFHGHA